MSQQPLPPSTKDLLKKFAAYLSQRNIVSDHIIRRVLKYQSKLDLRIGQLGILMQYISPPNVLHIVISQTDNELLFGETAIREGLLDHEQVQKLLALQNSSFNLFVELLRISGAAPEETFQQAVDHFLEGVQQPSPSDRFPATKTSLELAAIFVPKPKRIDAETLKAKLRGMKDLATLPAVAQHILALLAAREVNLHKVVKIIKADAALSARLLRLVNSACFGFEQRVANVERGIFALGIEGVKNVVIAACVMDTFRGVNIPLAQGIWRHSVYTAQWSRTVAEAKGMTGEGLEEIFMAGLLHDIGRLAIWQYFPDATTEIRRLVEEGLPELEAEREVLSHAHPDVGAFLCHLWKFPVNLTLCLMYHHAPPSVLSNMQFSLPVFAVNAGCRLAHMPLNLFGEDEDENEESKQEFAMSNIDEEFMEFHQIDREQILKLAPRIRQETRKLTVLLTAATEKHGRAQPPPTGPLKPG